MSNGYPARPAACLYPWQELEGEEGVCIPLQPGQATLHHIRLAHRSGPAAPDSQTRLGLAIRYMAAHVQQSLDPRDSGTWGRGGCVLMLRHTLPPHPRALARWSTCDVHACRPADPMCISMQPQSRWRRGATPLATTATRRGRQQRWMQRRASSTVPPCRWFTPPGLSAAATEHSTHTNACKLPLLFPREAP